MGTTSHPSPDPHSSGEVHAAPPRSVFVGVDGTPTASIAADWAAAYAVRLSLPLTLVTVQGAAVLGSADPAGVGPGLRAQVASLEASEEMIERVRVDLEYRHPGLAAESRAVIGTPSDGLRRVSGAESVLVVGSRGRSMWASALLGDTSDALVTQPEGPVVVIGGPTPPVWDRPVVLGVQLEGEATTSVATLDFAFDQAAVFQQAVTVVCVRSGQVPVSDEALQTLLERRHPRTAGVRWSVRRSDGDVVGALAEASVDASMLVVGSRGRNALAGLLQGSTSRRLLGAAHCPVAVVPGT